MVDCSFSRVEDLAVGIGLITLVCTFEASFRKIQEAEKTVGRLNDALQASGPQLVLTKRTDAANRPFGLYVENADGDVAYNIRVQRVRIDNADFEFDEIPFLKTGTGAYLCRIPRGAAAMLESMLEAISEIARGTDGFFGPQFLALGIVCNDVERKKWFTFRFQLEYSCFLKTLTIKPKEGRVTTLTFPSQS